MLYLFVLFTITIALYLTENSHYNSFLKQLTVWFLPFFVYFIPLAMQFEVGTDYPTYYGYFYNKLHFIYLWKGEFGFYYLQELVNYLGEPQYLFVFSGLINSVLLFYTLFLLKQYQFKSWIIFFIFFVSTGIYHNQMNGIRQFICIELLPIICILFFEKKYLKGSALIFLGSLFHSTGLIAFVTFFINKFITSNKKVLFFLFIFMFVICSYNFRDLIEYLLNNYILMYSHYIGSDNDTSTSIEQLLVKFYTLPLYFIFWIFYIKKHSANLHFNKDIFLFFIKIFTLTYFLFIQAYYFSLFFRIWQFFIFFSVFPLYYIYIRCNVVSKCFFVFYITLPYFLKVTLFASNEYLYSFYTGWF